MKKLRKLPFVLAFVVTLFAGSCSDETNIAPVSIDEELKNPPPPPPPGPNIISIDTVSVD
jgi:hypothetical protein